MHNSFDRSISNAIDGSGMDVVRREFLRLISKDYASIHSTVVSLVGNLTDADDVMQEACIKMWKAFDRFDRERSFRAWAVTIASNEARNFLKSRRRNRGFGVSDAAIDTMVKVRRGTAEFLELRQEKLSDCMAEMPVNDQQLVWDCYGRKTKVTEWAAEHKKPVNAVYSRLRRLRDKLYDCVNRKLNLDQ